VTENGSSRESLPGRPGIVRTLGRIWPALTANERIVVALVLILGIIGIASKAVHVLIMPPVADNAVKSSIYLELGKAAEKKAAAMAGRENRETPE